MSYSFYKPERKTDGKWPVSSLSMRKCSFAIRVVPKTHLNIESFQMANNLCSVEMSGDEMDWRSQSLCNILYLYKHSISMPMTSRIFRLPWNWESINSISYWILIIERAMSSEKIERDVINWQLSLPNGIGADQRWFIWILIVHHILNNLASLMNFSRIEILKESIRRFA